MPRERMEEIENQSKKIHWIRGSKRKDIREIRGLKSIYGRYTQLHQNRTYGGE